MKRTYLRTVVTVSLLSGGLVAYGQAGGGAGGAGGGGGAAGAAGGGTAAGGVATSGGVAAGGAASSGAAATAQAPGFGAGAATTTAPGAAGINQPSAIAPSTGASITEINPNPASRGTLSGSGIASPSTVSPNATTIPGAPGNAGQSLDAASLPTQVQSALRTLSGSGQLGSITQQQTQNGVVYRATVTQNGTPMELQIAPNGRILSRTAVTGTPRTGTATAANNADAGIQTGLPLSSLPADLRNNIVNRTGDAQIQSITRTDTADGTLFRVTADQNGVPTDYLFSPSGALINSAAVSPAATGAGTGVVVPGGAVVLDELPENLRSTISSQTGNGQISEIRSQQAANGLSYLISYDRNGVPMTMLVTADGRVVSNGPTAVRAAASTGRGSGTGTNRTASVEFDELPDDVTMYLKETAPTADIRYINKRNSPTGDVFSIGFEDDEGFVEVEVGEGGEVLSDSRKVPVIAVGPVRSEDTSRQMSFRSLPAAAQNAVKAYATSANVRNVSLGRDRDGKTVYDIVFYRDGRRDRMILAKDGSLVRIEENVGPAADLAASKEPMLAIGDLPQQVQDAIRRQTDNVMVKDINMREVGDQTAYQVLFDLDGEQRELLVGLDGAILQPAGPDLTDPRAVTLPVLQAEATEEEEEDAAVVRTVSTINPDDSQTDLSNDASGTSPALEQGSNSDSYNPSVAAESSAPTVEVRLSDVPVAVQNTAKKVAGSGVIESINPKLGDAGINYEIVYVQNGDKQSVIVNKDGETQQPKSGDSELE